MDEARCEAKCHGKLAVENLRVEFGDNTILQDVSFAVEDKEFLSILGPSGCGKTTILRVLLGLLKPTQGKIYKDGINITAFPPAKRKMGIVFQNYALFENMTVLNNVQYALKFDQEKKKDAYKIAVDLIHRVGLKEHMHKRPYKLSGGQQQRVAIARTLATSPDVILLDEPMSALDAEMRLSLRSEIKGLQKEFGSTMIYITHDQEEALAMSDRIMVLEKGVIQQIGTPMEIIDKPANTYVKSFVQENMRLKIDSLAQFFNKL
ncbi:MAG: ABC transporter ATP-binding protein [Peptococcaceae bacterium]|nr:ABC transporter ATP-binding protein [Peptococcaceae bacterium]